LCAVIIFVCRKEGGTRVDPLVLDGPLEEAFAAREQNNEDMQ
jgi:hypothetical protein